MEWRRHAFLKLIYVQAGAGTLYLGDHKQSFKPRDLLLAPVGVRNRLVDAAGRPASLYVLCVDRQLLRFDPEIENRFVPGLQPRSLDTARRVEGQFRRLLFEQSHGGEAASVAMVAATMDLLHLMLDRRLGSQPGVQGDPPDVEDNEVRRYAERLANHFYEATTIDDAASGLGMSRRRFTKAFREATGESWLAFVRTRAIEHAARRLAATTAPIASVAFECGFEDLSTFYRRFRALRGCTPGAWRARSGGLQDAPRRNE